jgi:hypothetical protein
MKKFLSIFIILSTIIFLPLFFYNNKINENKIEININPDIYSSILPYTSFPFEFQHNIYSTLDKKPLIQGSGVVDIVDSCNLYASYTGSLYKINYLANNNIIYSQTIKRETSTKTDWEKILPSTSNHNSVLLSLLGNDSNILCSLPNLSKVIKKTNSTYQVDKYLYKDILFSTYKKNRDNNRNLNLDKELINFSVDALLSKNVFLEIEKLDSITIKISILYKDNILLEDLVLRVKKDVQIPTLDKLT